MPDLRKLAILVIYQDGTTDSVPVGNEVFHIAYYRQLREKSERFRALTEDALDFKCSIHCEIELLLAQIGIITMFNENLEAVASHPEYMENGFEPEFVVCLPLLYASEAQKIEFYNTIRDYDKSLLCFGRIKENGEGFCEGDEVNKYVLSDELMDGSSNRGKRK